MLEAHLPQRPVPRSPQAARLDPLGGRPLDARPLPIAHGEVLAGLALARRPQNSVLLARAQREEPGAGRRAGASFAHRAGAAIRLAELDLVERVVGPRRLAPGAARLAPGAGHRARRPVDGEATHVEALVGRGLPAGVEQRRADQRDLV